MNKKNRFSFYFLWFVFLVIQATYTELSDDEAYYWKYSQNLEWGYFDHPPIIALLIRLGSVLLGHQNELSVRLLMIVLNIGTIYIIEKLVSPKNLTLFYAIVSSVIFIHIGFLAIPDTPLLFFTAFFFYQLRSYVENENFYNSIGLLLAIPLLLYSKYHGILVIVFTILANLKFLKRKSFYVIIFLSSLLYLPHIYWLYEHDFITIKYQLFDRSLEKYSISNTLEYLFSQFFVLSGLSSLLLFYFCFRYIPKSDMDKTFKWNFWGILFFFLLMTFKGRVEINWVSISLVPMIIITFRYIEDFKEKYTKLLYVLSISYLLCIMAIRFFLIFDFLPAGLIENFEFHNQKKWADQIKEKSNGIPVIFMNSYKEAAKYEFYSGVPSFSLNNIMGRKNQYSIESEEKFQGNTIFLIPNWHSTDLDSFRINNTWKNYKIITNFQSYSKIVLKQNMLLNQLPKNKDVSFKISITNNNKNYTDLKANKEYPSFLSYQFFSNNELISDTRTTIQLTNNMLNKDSNFTIRTPKNEGEYCLTLSISTGWLPPTINSENIKITVK